MWHCPHCGAPQAETARCWVCRRSSTTCSTCRHFRPSLAADVGYCAKDRWRTPLTGLELRACWEERRRAASMPLSPGGAQPDAEQRPGRAPTTPVRRDGGPLDRADPMRLRGFVPIEDLAEDIPRDGGRTSELPGTAPGPRKRRSGGRPSDDSRVVSPPPALAENVGGIDDWEKRVSLFGEADA